MGAKVFRDYAEVNEKMLEGFTVAEAGTGINEEGVPFRVSEEYVKHILR